MANFGMLGLGGEEAARAAEEQRQQQEALQLARLSPNEQVAYSRVRGAGMLGQGIGDLARTGLGAATGVDTRNAAEVARTVREQLAQAGVDPSDPDKFYPALIRILTQNGMVTEAAAASREYEDMSNKRQDRKLRERDIARKETNDAASQAAVKERLAIARSGTPQAKAEAVARLVDEMNAEADPKEMLRLEAQLQMFGYKPDRTRDWQVTLVQGNKNEPARILKYNRATGKYDVETLEGGVRGGSDTSAVAGAGENVTKVGILADRSGPVMKGSKTGKLYVYEGGSPVPYDAAAHGEWNATQTESEARAGTLGGRLTSANAQIESTDAKVGATRAKLYFAADGNPAKQAAIALTFSDADKQYIAAVRQFLNANLRYDSGAAVPESEYPKYMDALIPFDGDSEALRAQKRANREDTTKLIIRKTGGPTKPKAAPSAAPAAPGAVEVWVRGADGKLVKGK